MPYKCCIRDCSSLKTVFKVPNDVLIKNQWEKALGISFKKSHHVCAAHFNHNDIISAWESGDNEDPNFKYRICRKQLSLRKGAIPIPYRNNSQELIKNLEVFESTHFDVKSNMDNSLTVQSVSIPKRRKV